MPWEEIGACAGDAKAYEKEHVRISCVLTARELRSARTDLIVFPEGIFRGEIEAAQLSHPDSVIVGAIVENGRSRGLLRHRGKNRIDYLKVETDGRTTGTENLQQNPVYVLGDVCIGVLICMDINHGAFSRAVIENIKFTSAKLKLLCVPADMADYYFSGQNLASPQNFEGVHVILCNHTNAHPQDRCKSFVTDTHGTKVVVQNHVEPIHTNLPYGEPLGQRHR